jgi:hypothetical protein
MSNGVRQIQVVQGDIAANRLLADGWVYLQSVAVAGTVHHVLGHETPAAPDDRRMRVLREAIPVTRAMSMPSTETPGAKSTKS